MVKLLNTEAIRFYRFSQMRLNVSTIDDDNDRDDKIDIELLLTPIIACV